MYLPKILGIRETSVLRAHVFTASLRNDFQLLGARSQPYQGSAHEPHWGTSPGSVSSYPERAFSFLPTVAASAFTDTGQWQTLHQMLSR